MVLSKEKTKILVTGVYGFLGSHIAKKLNTSYEVIGLYNKNTSNSLDNNIAVYNDLGLVKETPDIVIMSHAVISSGRHKADRQTLFNANVDFTKKLIDRYPDSKCIYISSVSVYGETEVLIDENSAINSTSEYSKSKWQGEQLVLANSRNVVIRFSSIYGEGMKENTIVPIYCSQAIQNGEIEVWGNGKRTQNYIHVDDATDLIKLVVESKVSIDFPILGVSHNEYSNVDLARIISNETNAKITFSGNDSSSSLAFNNFRTTELFNWNSKVSLTNGIKKYLEWKKAQ